MRVMCAILLSFLVGFVGAEELTFRGHSFETTLQEFIAAEGEPDRRTEFPQEEHWFSDQMIKYFDTTAAGYPVDTLEAIFKDNALRGGIYVFDLYQENSSSSQYLINLVDAYIDLQSKLLSLYGEASSRDDIEELTPPVSSLYQRLMIQEAPYQTNWNYGDGLIQLSLMFQDEKWQLSTGYFSPALNETINARQEARRNNTDGL